MDVKNTLTYRQAFVKYLFIVFKIILTKKIKIVYSTRESWFYPKLTEPNITQ